MIINWKIEKPIGAFYADERSFGKCIFIEAAALSIAKLQDLVAFDIKNCRCCNSVGIAVIGHEIFVIGADENIGVMIITFTDAVHAGSIEMNSINIEACGIFFSCREIQYPFCFINCQEMGNIIIAGSDGIDEAAIFSMKIVMAVARFV